MVVHFKRTGKIYENDQVFSIKIKKNCQDFVDIVLTVF